VHVGPDLGEGRRPGKERKHGGKDEYCQIFLHMGSLSMDGQSTSHAGSVMIVIKHTYYL
jgi:hypothetical protein